MTQKKWSPIKEIVFTYLAINKIMYWFNTITAMNQSELSNVGHAIFMRVLNHDLMMIVGVVAFFWLNSLIELKKTKYSKVWEYVLFYVIGYFVLVAIVIVYNWVLIMIFSPQDLYITELIRGFISFMPNFTIGYIVVAVALEVKIYFKNKGKESPAAAEYSAQDKLAVLESLLEENILTQEVFEQTKEKLLHNPV